MNGSFHASPLKVTTANSSNDDSQSDTDDWVAISSVIALEGSNISSKLLAPSSRDRSRVKRILSSTVSSSNNPSSPTTSKRKRRTRRSKRCSDEDSDYEDENSSSSSHSVSKLPSKSSPDRKSSRISRTSGSVELVVQTRKGAAAERKRRIVLHGRRDASGSSNSAHGCPVESSASVCKREAITASP